MAYYSKAELDEMGFAALGTDVLLSRKATVLRPDLIHIGNRVRIDDFCIISPSSRPFSIGSHIHIGPYSSLIGGESITMRDFSGLSARVTIYSSSDDYSGMYMTNPMVPEMYRNVVSKPVLLGRHVIVGAGAVILPGVTVGDSSAIAAMSLVTKSVKEGMVAGGVPCRAIRPRLTEHLSLERKMRGDQGG